MLHMPVHVATLRAMRVHISAGPRSIMMTDLAVSPPPFQKSGSVPGSPSQMLVMFYVVTQLTQE